MRGRYGWVYYGTMSCDAPSALLARKWRATTTLNQSEAADALGIHQSTLTKIEGGDRRPSLSLLKKMSALYSLTPDDLAEGVMVMVGADTDVQAGA